MGNPLTRPIDINRDGFPDFLYLNIVNNGGGNYVRTGAFVLGTGLGSVELTVHTIQFPSDMTEIFSFSNSYCKVVDLNNDGYLDLLSVVSIPNGTPHPLRRYKYSLGQPQPNYVGNSYIFGPVTDLGIEFITWSIDYRNPVFDFNNDGQIDIFYEGDPTTYPPGAYPTKYILNNTLPFFMAGILLSVRDEFGKVTTFTYGNSYPFTGNVVPYRFPILTQVEERDNFSPARTFTYTYDTPRYDRIEREFQGFGHVRETDAGGIVTNTYFLQDRPRLGFVDHVQKSNGLTITNIYPNNTAQPYDNPLQSTTRSEAEKQVTNSFVYDNYGNATQETMSANSGDPDIVIQKSFIPNTGAWLVSFPYQETETMGSSTKTVDYRYDGESMQPFVGDITHVLRYFSTESRYVNEYFSYDSYGNRISHTDGNGYVTYFHYDNNYHSFLTQTDYPYSLVTHQTSWESGGGFGQARTKTDFNGNVTTYEYDGFGRLGKVIGPNDSNSIFGSVSYTYNLGSPGNNYKETRETKEYGTAQVYYSKESYDGFRQVVQNISDGENGQTIYSSKTYDYRGNLLTSTFPGYGNPGPAIQYEYDLLDRLRRVTSPDGGYIENTYSGWTTTIRDENGRFRDVTHDSRNRIKQVVERNGSDAYTTQYQYNVFDHVTRIQDHSGNVWNYGYDSLGRKTNESDPDLGAITFHYDDNGNLIRKDNARGIYILYQYDQMNRMASKNYSNTTEIDATYVYDELDVSNGKGKRTRMIDPSGETRWHYDNEGRVIREIKGVVGFSNPFTIEWTYDAMDRIKTIIYPNNRTIQYAYNDQALPETISGFATGVEYTAYNKETRINLTNSLTNDYSYRSDNKRLVRIFVPGHVDQNYEYDLAGNIRRIYDSAHGWDKSYVYDDLNRLRSGDGQSFDFNAIGNLTQKNGVSQQYTSVHPHALTHDGFNAYNYDETGNMLTGAGRNIIWDAENRPISIQKDGKNTTFIYDGDGERIIKMVQDSTGTRRTIYVKDLFEKVV